jgi:hypothetical protein
MRFDLDDEARFLTKLEHAGVKIMRELVKEQQAGPAQQQSGRGVMSASSTMRAQDATFRIAPISPTLLVHSRHRPQHFQHPAPSHILATLRVLRNEAFRTRRVATVAST